MADPHVVSALRAKRAEISGHIHDLEKKVRTWRARLAHIDASIRMFSPETDPEAIPPRRTYRRAGYFRRGELARLCLDQLRKAGGKPLTAGEIAKAAIADRGLPADSSVITDMVLVVLRRLCKRGTAIKHGTSRNARWGLPKNDAEQG